MLNVNIQWEQKQGNLLEWPIVTITYDSYLDIYSIQVQDDYGLRQVDSIRNCQNTSYSTYFLKAESKWFAGGLAIEIKKKD